MDFVSETKKTTATESETARAFDWKKGDLESKTSHPHSSKLEMNNNPILSKTKKTKKYSPTHQQ